MLAALLQSVRRLGQRLMQALSRRLLTATTPAATRLVVGCAGWLGHPLAQRRHDPPKEAARSQRTEALCPGAVSTALSIAFNHG